MDCMNTKKTLYRCALIACLGGMRVLDAYAAMPDVAWQMPQQQELQLWINVIQTMGL